MSAISWSSATSSTFDGVVVSMRVSWIAWAIISSSRSASRSMRSSWSTAAVPGKFCAASGPRPAVTGSSIAPTGWARPSLTLARASSSAMRMRDSGERISCDTSRIRRR